MTYPKPSKIYKQHCKNLRKLDHAIKLIQRDLRIHISKEERDDEFSYNKIFSHLVTAWLEVRLYKLIHEPQGFNDTDVRLIETTSKAEERWTVALEIALCKVYKLKYTKQIIVTKENGTTENQILINIPKNLASKLPFTIKARYEELKKLITKDLKTAIEIRNKIAHGQWEFPFNMEMTKISSTAFKNLKDENIVKIQLRMEIFKNLSLLIHYLNVSPDAFDKHFDKLYKIIESNQQNYKNRDYQQYKIKLVEKYQRGLIKRNDNKEGAGKTSIN
jgi:hypothetical protein